MSIQGSLPRPKAPALFLLAAIFGSFGAAKDPKPTPDEIVARHLESIGKPDAIQKVLSRVANGTALASIQVGGAGVLSGKASVISKGPLVRIGMVFPAQEYSGEHFAYNGKRVSVGNLVPGVRSVLSGFLYQNDALMREGILGGTLTTAWPLLALPIRQPRLSYGGLQKSGAKAYHTLKYRPRKGGMDVQVTLYFDPETFRHLRTECDLEIGPQIVGDINQSARQQETRYKLVEEFSDFSEVDGLMLPHSYKMQYSSLSMNHTVLSTWTLTLSEFLHNQPIEENLFNLQ